MVSKGRQERDHIKIAKIESDRERERERDLAPKNSGEKCKYRKV